MAHKINEKSPAEESAERNGWETATITAIELIRVAEGNPMIVATSGGRAILLRLPSPAEFKAAALAAGAESVSDAEAARIVAPLPTDLGRYGL